MAVGLLLIPAVGGYWFLTHLNYTRFYAARASGYHLLFRSALFGGLLFLLARLITLGLESFNPGIVELWTHHFPDPYSIEVVLSLILGYLLPLVVNPLYSEEQGARKIALESGDYMELLIADSILKGQAIEVSLRSRKSYVGLALESGVKIGSDTDISLVPLASGYRDEDTLDLHIMINYVPVIQKYTDQENPILTEEDFRIVIPISEVVSVRLFVPEVFDEFQEETSEVTLIE